MTPQSTGIPGLKSYVVCFGGFCVYLGLFDSALQKEKSFPEAISLEISPTGVLCSRVLELSREDKEVTGI